MTQRAGVCPQVEKHTPHPAGYITHYVWAMRMLKTHTQVQCPGCGLWKIWVRRRFGVPEQQDDAVAP